VLHDSLVKVEFVDKYKFSLYEEDSQVTKSCDLAIIILGILQVNLQVKQNAVLLHNWLDVEIRYRVKE
jgi:hypothetical protein